jgi:hypothetical protein
MENKSQFWGGNTSPPPAGFRTDGEHYACAVLYTLFGCMFLMISLICFLGNHIGSMPRFVKWELDNIFGPMVGVAKTKWMTYSIAAGIWNFIGAACCYFAWEKWDQNYVIVSINGMCMIWKFASLEMVYRLCTNCPKWKLFAGIGSILTGLVIWRCVRFVLPSHYNYLLCVTMVNLGIGIGEWVGIYMKSKKMQDKVKLVTQYRVYVENNPKFVWTKGASQPDGLVIPTDLANGA